MRRLPALAAMSFLTVACAGQLDTVRPVMPEADPVARGVWPAYVTADDHALLDEAERRIDDVRKGELLVSVLDARGLRALGMDIAWKQTSHDFRFGVAGMFTPAVWGDLVRAGVNHGAVAVDWAGTEPKPDTWTLESVEASHGLGILPAMGVSMRATAALWMSPGRTPEHIQRLKGKALVTAVDRHVRGLVSKLRGPIALWEAVREPNAEWAAGVARDPDAMVLLAQTAAAAVRMVDPVTPIGISLPNPFGEGQVLAPMAFVKRLLDAKVDLDVIGLEYYYNGHQKPRRDGTRLVATPEARRGLTEIAANLDDFARFGRALHISGVAVPSEPNPADPALAGYWGRRWSEALQAVYLRAFYTVAFSHEAVQAIVWRDATDAMAVTDHGGLFRKPASPKPSFHALADLIDGWTTRGAGRVGEEGQLRFRGFGGGYVLEVQNPLTGERLSKSVRVREGELDSVVVELPESWLPAEPAPALVEL